VERAGAALLAFADGVSRSPQAHVTLVRALARFQALEGAEATARDATSDGVPAARPAEPPAAASPSTEDEAYDAVEVYGRLGSGVEEEWKPFRVELELRKGWHANANPAAQGLVPTAVAEVVGRLRNVRYPAGETWDGGAGAVPVYRGRVVIEGEIEHRGGGAPAVELAYQACDDARCLPPVTRIVRLK
jgi:hypothetical protein